MNSSRTPRTARICLEAVASLALCLSVSASWASSRMGTAEVLLQDGQACFNVPAKDAKRDPAARLQVIVVSDASKGSQGMDWSMNFDRVKGRAISSVRCFPYGQVPEDATSGPVPPLSDGKAYNVYLNVRASDPSDPTMGYSANFCVVGQGRDRRIKYLVVNPATGDLGRCE